MIWLSVNRDLRIATSFDICERSLLMSPVVFGENHNPPRLQPQA